MSNKSSLVKDTTQQQTSSKQIQTKKKKTSFYKWLWTFWFMSIIGAVLFFTALSNGWLNWLIPMPDPDELENPQISIASEIYSYDNLPLGKFYKERSIPVDYKELSPNLVRALIDTEDERFTSHSGIDVQALIRAIKGMGKDGGGSTITQQLAKMLFTQEQHRLKKNNNRILQKLGEWVIAVQLEKRFTKEEIIAMYFNKFEYQYNVIGIKMAAKLFFNKLPKDLSVDESAILVGMFKSPSAFNPKNNVKKSIERRNVVLFQMHRNNDLTQAEYEKYIELPIKLNYQPPKEEVHQGASYFKDFVKEEVNDLFAKNNIKKINGQQYDVDIDGLKIYTTIDTRMQANAEEAAFKHMAKLQSIFNTEKRGNPNFPFRGKTIGPKTIDTIMYRAVRQTGRYKSLKEKGMSDPEIIQHFKTHKINVDKFSYKGSKLEIMTPWDSIRYYKSIVQVGVMSMEPQTGFVKAWVGGVDYKYFQYDHVKKGKRQVGSTFKPFVYATAISEKHLSPCYAVSNATYNSGGWRLKGGGGQVPIKIALAKSLNTVTARLIDMTTPKPVISLCRDLGITADLPNNNTIALGTSEISLYEMVAAYCAFANSGIYTKPAVIWRIEDKDGQILYEYSPQTREVFSQDVAYTMLRMMQGAADIKGGTSTRLRGMGLKNSIACKTGTTNSNSDGWFIGIVPNLVTGVWVGWEDRSAHFASTALGQGASMALPVWAQYMKANYANPKLEISSEKFEPPVYAEGEEPSIDYNCSGAQGYKSFGELGYLDSEYGVEAKKTKQPVQEKTYQYQPQDTLDVNEQMQIEGDIPGDVID